MDERGFTTRALGGRREDLGDAVPVAPPIHPAATFAFEDPEILADLIRRGKDVGYVYTRWHNPTRDTLERLVAELEGGERAVSFSSGMASIVTTLSALAMAGDHVVSSPALYGGSFSTMSKLLPRWGVEVTLAESHRAEDMIAAVRPDTKLVYTETIGNPLLSVPDLEALGAACRERGVPLVVDNTFASPYLCRPLGLGAAVVVHSTTKYIGGHSDLTGGIAAGDGDVLHEIRETSVDIGGTANAWESWLALRGLETLALRMERHVENARALAALLEDHPVVEQVWYPGLSSHPDHEVAQRILRAPGGMISFELAGGLEAGRRFQESLEVALVGPSLGSTRTLVVHPPSVTHTQMTREQREAAGITDGFVRVSTGIEDVEDVLEDFRRALEKA
ncbi:MAG TPA: aminotransferase class I/II-fold pyridoxal phosphate-dependent enzyme [Actinomycetota bacterium]|nr:aminotransferase class I/II-fold pyridoxal phosphate-dependent enzyme [Actinomycetota bacterium]